jgi:hypothetical protein
VRFSTWMGLSADTTFKRLSARVGWPAAWLKRETILFLTTPSDLTFRTDDQGRTAINVGILDQLAGSVAMANEIGITVAIRGNAQATSRLGFKKPTSEKSWVG